VRRRDCEARVSEVRLYCGAVALVDDADLSLVAGYRWHIQQTSPDHRYAKTSLSERRTVLMHRLILSAPRGKCVDHIDGNGLNNQRTNLRLCTTAENLRNRVRTRSLSGYRGVAWDHIHEKWQAHFTLNRKAVTLGNFKDPADAARCWDEAARKHYGAFGTFNFPRPGERGVTRRTA
jgi:hypothetical protein